MTDVEDVLSGSFDPNAKISTNVYYLAHRFLKQCHFATAKANGGVPIWRYEESEGIWKDDGESYIRKEVDRAAAEFTSTHLANELVASLKAKVYTPTLRLGENSNKIVCQNGLLNLETGELEETFNPEEYHVTRLPIVYDPAAECPNFLKFLDDVIAYPEDKEAIIEFIGYCLFKQYVFEIVVMLVGEGANGKSILLSVIKQFLGSENVSSVTPQQLEKSRFASAQLFGKLADICGDIPAQPLQYTGLLKMLTGGDLVHAEHKNRDPFDFVNYAKLIFSANQVPESWDASHAFYRRFRIIDFPNQFTPESKNFVPRDQLLESLTLESEKSGLLNLALGGLKRLRSQGQLSGERSITEKRMDYIQRSDPAHYFFEKFMYQDPEAPFFPKSLLYDMYVKFANCLDKVAIADTTFAKKVKRLVPYVGESKPREGDQRVTVWTGFRFRQQEYDDELAGRGGRGGQGILANCEKTEDPEILPSWPKNTDHPDHPDQEGDED
jgi:putative DNA primase/helicase